MDEVLQKAEEWRAAGEPVALATVVATRRSSPRPPGSKLAVTAGGRLFGSVSGGCVEADVAARAQAILAGEPPELVSYGIADEQAWAVGLPCGGEIDVFVEPLVPGPERPVVFTVIEGEPLGAKLELPEELERAALRRGRSHVFEHDGRTIFADVSGPPPCLFVYGAVDTAEALCKTAKLLGWKTVVADARARFATKERIPSADELLVVWPDDALAQQPPDTATAIFVLTHDDKFDLPMLTAAVKTDAFYIGALGSRRNQERRRELLREAGLTEEELERISGPAGLDIGADSPAETALSMLAEALAVRAGRTGGRLQDSPHRIHAEPVAGKK